MSYDDDGGRLFSYWAAFYHKGAERTMWRRERLLNYTLYRVKPYFPDLWQNLKTNHACDAWWGSNPDSPLLGTTTDKKKTPLSEVFWVPDGGRTHNNLIHSQGLCHWATGTMSGRDYTTGIHPFQGYPRTYLITPFVSAISNHINDPNQNPWW